MLAAALAGAVIGAFFNRASGMDRWAPGRNIYYTGPLLGLLVWVLTQSWHWGLAAWVSAWTYRLIGWYHSIDMGKDKDTILRDASVMFARGLLAFPFFFYPVFFLGVSPVDASVLLVSASLFATFGYMFGNWVLRDKYPKDYNTVNELLAGAAFGFAGGMVLTMNGAL